MSYADRKIEAVNRITNECITSIPYWRQDPTITEDRLIEYIIDRDVEVREEIRTLFRAIIEEYDEIKSATQKDDA